VQRATPTPFASYPEWLGAPRPPVTRNNRMDRSIGVNLMLCEKKTRMDVTNFKRWS
jgi:hypothetical protein